MAASRHENPVHAESTEFRLCRTLRRCETALNVQRTNSEDQEYSSSLLRQIAASIFCLTQLKSEHARLSLFLSLCLFLSLRFAVIDVPLLLSANVHAEMASFLSVSYNCFFKPALYRGGKSRESCARFPFINLPQSLYRTRGYARNWKIRICKDLL